MSIENRIAGARVEVCCPDPRCRWSLITNPDTAEEKIAQHLAADARHNGGSWIDRDGNERVGMEYAACRSSKGK